MAKVSFITTVLNEADTIGALLDSLQVQTQKPDEVIIVDGGSTDNTEEIVKKYQTKEVLTYRYIRMKGNRAKGRNVGVVAAQYPIIAVSDAGCTLDDDWLQRLVEPFSNPNLDAVAGYYLPVTDSLWKKCFAPYLAVMSDRLNQKTFLPSSRSLAFRKASAQALGGYPEHLDYCEDLVLARRLKLKANMGVVTSAIVHWQLPANLRQFFQSLRHYARGDLEARYWPHLIKIATVFGRYAILALFPWLFPLYWLYPIAKHWHYVKHPLGFIYLPLTQLTADLAVMTGVII